MTVPAKEGILGSQNTVIEGLNDGTVSNLQLQLEQTQKSLPTSQLNQKTMS